MAEAQTKDKPATDTKPAKPPKEVKPQAPRSIAGHPLTAVISFGVNKEGKKYGPDNNPKRAGSSAAARFTLYKEGMTLEQALKAGVRSDDIGFDCHETRKFITIK
jgi:hypothetical protein